MIQPPPLSARPYLQLDEVAETVGVLKQMGHIIGNELDEQAELLDDFENEMENTSQRLVRTLAKVDKALNITKGVVVRLRGRAVVRLIGCAVVRLCGCAVVRRERRERSESVPWRALPCATPSTNTRCLGWLTRSLFFCRWEAVVLHLFADHRANYPHRRLHRLIWDQRQAEIERLCGEVAPFPPDTFSLFSSAGRMCSFSPVHP